MPHLWVIRIIEYLAGYARDADLPKLAAHLDEARDLGMAEIAAQPRDGG